jgi:hypothetical protein
MDAGRRELYREETGWAVWVYLLLWSAIGGSALSMFLGQGDAAGWTEPGRLGAALGILALGGLIQLLFGGLTVIVDREGISAGLGKGWLLKTRIGWQEIESLESVTYSPFREFGGWGLRGGRNKRAWTARGNQSVVLHLRDGRRIYLGSDHPNRLESRIRGAMGTAGAHGIRSDDD